MRIDEPVEGVLFLFWDNRSDSKAIPQYTLTFASMKDLSHGAQNHKHIIGTDALASYLSEIGFTSKNVKYWIARLHAEVIVPIQNIALSQRFLADYGDSAVEVSN
jgi:hypothetical protein